MLKRDRLSRKKVGRTHDDVEIETGEAVREVSLEGLD
jgi:hypothetical protein